jgi:hypothetical protein
MRLLDMARLEVAWARFRLSSFRSDVRYAEKRRMLSFGFYSVGSVLALFGCWLLYSVLVVQLDAGVLTVGMLGSGVAGLCFLVVGFISSLFALFDLLGE